MSRILILSFYYEPDLSAGSFRTSALVRALLPRLRGRAAIDVITTLPNRYSSFTVDVPEREEREGLRIHRLRLPRHQSGMIDQSRAFLFFARAAARLASRERYDVVYATSSRLMTAVLGAWIARRQGARLFLDIRDIFVETILNVVPDLRMRALLPLLTRLERFALTAADRVNLVSEGFADYFRLRYRTQRYTFIPNGIDDEFLYLNKALGIVQTTALATRDACLLVVYAGNIGEGQGLHDIIPGLARRLEGRVRFRLIGDGGRHKQLVDAVAKAGVTNVEILPPMRRDALIAEYRAADVLFLHLNDYPAFRKVLPSKVFEYGASGKPIWAGVSGYCAAFLREHVENVAVFSPCDVEGGANALSGLSFEWCARTSFIERFDRGRLSGTLADDVASLLTNG